MSYCIVYISIVSDETEHDDLVDIVEKSRQKNERLGVTGVLLCRDCYFMQAIEGDRDVVRSLYNDKIRYDERHYNVRTVFEDEIPERIFEGWAMAFKALGNSDYEVTLENEVDAAEFLYDRNHDAGPDEDVIIPIQMMRVFWHSPTIAFDDCC